MTSLREIVQWLQSVAPLQLSEEWDNTGLLLGDEAAEVTRVMTCLTLTYDCVDEAIARGAHLVVTHHPLPFRPVASITTRESTGRRIWKLASHGIAVYSPHTAWDSAATGINTQLARLVEPVAVEPILPYAGEDLEDVGTGRIAQLAEPSDFDTVARRIVEELPHSRPRGVPTHRPIQRIAIACGSGGSLFADALAREIDMFVTGEASYHTCLEAVEARVGLLMVGHFASERFAMEHLARQINTAFRSVEAWPADCERDPVRELRYR